ncbi:MAG TPA: HAD family hydrolase [Thermomicrobiales bacterium]|nr:HAD family hydrolase [Thermomicrobiales bacterium]
MNGQAITFDFHNTLAHCDPWFDLEVHHLPSAFLRWLADHGGPVRSDETLADADAAYRRLRHAIVEHGNELPAEACVAYVLDDLGIAVDDATVERGVATLMRATLAEAEPTHGAIETVRALAETGVPLGIVSSAVYHPFLDWTLERFGIRDAFRDVTTSASAGFYKSRPELYLHAVARLDAVPERTVHVGDSWRFDVDGARRAGLRTVWLRRADASLPAGGAAPDLTVRTLVGAAPRILTLLAGAGA